MSLLERLTRRQETLQGVNVLHNHAFMATFTETLYSALEEKVPPRNRPITGFNKLCGVVNTHAAEILKEQYGLRTQLLVKRGLDWRHKDPKSLIHAFIAIKDGFHTIYVDFSYKQNVTIKDQQLRERPDYLVVRWRNESQLRRGLQQYGITDLVDLSNYQYAYPEETSQYIDPYYS